MAFWLHVQVLRAIDVPEAPLGWIESPPLGFGDGRDIQGGDECSQAAFTCLDQFRAAFKHCLASQCRRQRLALISDNEAGSIVLVTEREQEPEDGRLKVGHVAGREPEPSKRRLEEVTPPRVVGSQVRLVQPRPRPQAMWPR